MSDKRIQPRPAWVNSTIITIASLLLAFVVSAVIMVIADAEVSSKWAYFFAPGRCARRLLGQDRAHLPRDVGRVGGLGLRHHQHHP